MNHRLGAPRLWIVDLPGEDFQEANTRAFAGRRYQGGQCGQKWTLSNELVGLWSCSCIDNAKQMIGHHDYLHRFGGIVELDISVGLRVFIRTDCSGKES